MRKKICYKGTETVKGTNIKGRLLNIIFTSKEKDYKWTPEWNDVLELFDEASETELSNFPESTFVEKFADIAEKVFKRCTMIKTANTFYGTIEGYSGGKLEIEVYDPYTIRTKNGKKKPTDKKNTVYREVSPAFRVTQTFLENWIGKDYVEFMSINGKIVKLREWKKEWEYPR